MIPAIIPKISYRLGITANAHVLNVRFKSKAKNKRTQRIHTRSNGEAICECKAR